MPLRPRLRPVAVAFAAALAVAIVAQTPPGGALATEGARVDAYNARIARLDVLSKILPLNLKKAQIEALTVALEKARARQAEILKLDADQLAKLDGDVQKAIEDAYAKGAAPPKELQVRIVQVTSVLGIRRQMAFGEMKTIVDTVVDKELDAGQRAVMANTLKPEAMDPSLKGKTMTAEDRERFFIGEYFINDSAYEILLRLARTAR